jgi:hypothetical protein
MPKFKDKPATAGYGRSAGPGTWIANPARSCLVAGWHIELGLDTSTGLMTAIVKTAIQ